MANGSRWTTSCSTTLSTINATLSSPNSSRSKSLPAISTELLGAGAIPDSIWKSWTEFQAQDPKFASPYFFPEFTQAVMKVRDDVEVALFRDANQSIVGVLPFQRVNQLHGEPVGGRLNDVHGLIGCPELDDLIDVGSIGDQLLKPIGLSSIGFHAGRGDDPVLKPFQFRQLESHYLDISQGWDTYYAWAKKNSSTIKRHGQKSRALARDFGEVRFEFQSADADVLEQLIGLKRKKYQRTKTFDILSVDWASNLLREIHQVRGGRFQGILSAIWAGDHLVAAHIGMLTDTMLHYWFPVFDPKFSKYSPGTELLLRVAQQASSMGIEKLDLGYGDDPYKFRFANATESVHCGLVTTSSTRFQMAKARYVWRQRLKQIPMKPMVKRLLRKVYPGFGEWNFR